MKLGNTGCSVTKSADGTRWYNLDGNWKSCTSPEETQIISNLSSEFRKGISRTTSEEMVLVEKAKLQLAKSSAVASTDLNLKEEVTSQQVVAQNIMKFFSEFYFEPNFRFVNTLALLSKEGSQVVRDYVRSYFELSDSEFTNSLVEKTKSPEFESLVNSLSSLEVKTKVNNRFKLYYGSQGTGKTTKALEETEGLCMICHSAMLPSDLMEDFNFDDGKAGFNPSILWKSITEGKKICLDEINLLPFESLRFLQSILDGKKEFTYKGQVVKIKEGFQVIGTMNLVVNGSVFSLPEPLIDRAESLKKFQLTAQSLAGALV